MREVVYALSGESGDGDSDEVESLIQWNGLPVPVGYFHFMSVAESCQNPQRKRREPHVLQIPVLPAVDEPSWLDKQYPHVRLLEKVVSGRGVPYMFNELLQQAGLQWLELEAILFQKTTKPYLIPLNGSSVLKFYLHKLDYLTSITIYTV